jgi:hypothetical protein
MIPGCGTIFVISKGSFNGNLLGCNRPGGNSFSTKAIRLDAQGDQAALL